LALHNLLQTPPAPDISRRPEWTWKIGLVLETPELVNELVSALAEGGAAVAFELPASASSFEVANAVEREKPDILFVELSRTSRPAAEWISDVRRGEETPLVAAVHPVAEPAEMISALRAGSSEFLCLPVRPAIYDAMDRIGSILEARRSATTERGRIAGILSAKGGCGATTIAAYLGVALQHHYRMQSGAKQSGAKQPALPPNAPRVLVADLDYQSPGGSAAFGVNPRSHAGNAFESVRRLSSHAWREYATPVAAGIDLLASPADRYHSDGSFSSPSLPEQWRVESLFRFLSRHYSWIFVDLGRHLNPSNWTLLQNIEELFVVTAPDVLALYQTRSILQTLSNRGFEKSLVRIILNRNQSSPQDFWVESIQQMFDMGVFGVVPNDEAALEKSSSGDRFEFPAETPFGRAMTKIAARLAASDSMHRHGRSA
jgi:Flp pilus assembly CpaE family ATPase